MLLILGTKQPPMNIAVQKRLEEKAVALAKAASKGTPSTNMAYKPTTVLVGNKQKKMKI